MKNIDELYLELKTLPKGYISKKTINGHAHYYLQRFENGNWHSEYVSDDQLNETKKKIALRKKIEKQIREIENRGSDLVTLSKNHQRLTGYLMSGDDVVASFDDGVLVFIDEERAPISITRSQTLQSFLSRRVFDDSRVNTRILKKVLFIKESDPTYISLLVHGASISDNYWFKAKGSRTKYKDIVFTDYYADTALKGIVYPLNKRPKLSPELTLNGSYEKCWKLIDNHWWLFKKENKNELFSELLASRIASLLGIFTVEYQYDNGFIKCLNFAEHYNFEPMSSLCDDDDSYEHVFNAIYARDEHIALDYLKLMMFDIIVNNVDRHNQNYGFLRDRLTGKLVCLAPNYDNNLSLISVDPNLNSKDGFLSVFHKFLSHNAKAYELYKNIHLPFLDEKKLKNILDELPIKIDNEDELITYILSKFYKVTNL